MLLSPPRRGGKWRPLVGWGIHGIIIEGTGELTSIPGVSSFVSLSERRLWVRASVALLLLEGTISFLADVPAETTVFTGCGICSLASRRNDNDCCAKIDRYSRVSVTQGTGCWLRLGSALLFAHRLCFGLFAEVCSRGNGIYASKTMLLPPYGAGW